MKILPLILSIFLIGCDTKKPQLISLSDESYALRFDQYINLISDNTNWIGVKGFWPSVYRLTLPEMNGLIRIREFPFNIQEVKTIFICTNCHHTNFYYFLYGTESRFKNYQNFLKTNI